MNQLFPNLSKDTQQKILEILQRIRSNPPQVLLFDGGTENERRDLARFWACCNLCDHEAAPCLQCRTCLQIANDQNVDILAYDGFISKKEDEENTGFFRALNAENARNLKTLLRDAPRGRYRFVFFTGIAGSKPEAPNALLKVLEEPSPYTLFVLLVPQRDQILPTLVSRSLCLTLPWPDELVAESTQVRQLTDSLSQFLAHQGNFLTTITAKAFMTPELAKEILIACQKSVIRVLAQQRTTDLDYSLSNFSHTNLLQFVLWLRESQDYLFNAISPVTPSRVLEALAMQLYCLRAKQ
ncbi:MAG: DNA polymerase III subunit delta' [Desulfovibrio sp.]|nr:DNA polymerase III subunit delta' [Desulfovibrio sp.]